MSGFRDSKATFTPSDNYWFFPPLAHDFDLGKNIHTEGFTLKYFHLVTFFCEWDNWEQYLTRKESVGHPGVRWEVCQEIFMYFQILFLRFNTTWILNPLTKGALSGKRFYWFQLKLDNQNRKLLEGHTSISWNTRQLDFTRNWDYSFSFRLGFTLSLLTAFLWISIAFLLFSAVFLCIPAYTTKPHSLCILLLATCRDQFQINGQEKQRELAWGRNHLCCNHLWPGVQGHVVQIWLPAKFSIVLKKITKGGA